MSLNESTLLTALQAVTDPNTGKDFVTTKAVRQLQIQGGDVSFDLEMGYPARSQHVPRSDHARGAKLFFHPDPCGPTKKI